MITVLIGKYTNTLDPKGRVIIPAAFRYDLKEKFIITKGIEKCLYIYPEEEWISLVDRLKKAMPSSKEANRKALRFFSSNAAECELDKQGRILIPQHLREYASLSKELLFIGSLNKVEVWNPEFYEDADAEEVGAMLEEMDIEF
ncbi:protein MraZ [Thermoclostridium stercorarium subsp. stercorarium DSM 8532]|uniref:Transcriptional regulator MraZ n=1 Tax=Thermoclostridium stercorarium (strain ATCC 35414 / DSM 8532 / NCIMB 11754) TaxID=1121335 RepID=L7VLU9_THES1|nr:division/cell wall cluster transcriptional repressor MraZ [Thermoclostridium stercorarium]AGC69150.1 protein MraZ [Thermoclostridium stercorarium subsp. stercorarium DSM 8532]UZQ85118.1 division/cell wall cluster transcriptional repressor MraZ [Thermoclostridium stercorarium]